MAKRASERRDPHPGGHFEPGAVPMERLLVTDIGLAQPLLGKEGRLDRIVFKLSETQAHTLQTAPASPMPPSAPWLEPHQPGARCQPARRCPGAEPHGAPLLAMAVGLFLVFNAQRFVQSVRRPS